MKWFIAFTAIALIGACQPAPDAPQSGVESYRGRWLVINYWAQWCAPCRTEIPDLNKLALHSPEQIAVLGVNFDGLDGEALNQATAEMGILFPITEQDPATTLGYQRPQALPTTYIIDPDGQLAHQLTGPQSHDQLVELIDQAASAR